MRQEDLSGALLAACPSAEWRWHQHLKWWGADESGVFNDVAVFAHHAVDSYGGGQTGEFPSFFELLERLIREGDPLVVEIATVGLIEDIQNIASHEPFGYSAFEPWLGPASRREWRRIEAIWSGKASLAEVLRDEVD